MLDQAFEALATYDWGTEPNVLKPIDEAVISSYGDSSARGKLEGRLVTVLNQDVPRAAKDYVCRKLMLIGTSASVPALAALLPNAELSHMARFALERIPDAAAATALRAAVAQLNGPLQVGLIGSLGARGDAASVAELSTLLGDSDATVARAAAYALGAIRTPQAAKALASAIAEGGEARTAACDATLACGEQLLEEGKRAEAMAVYKQLAGEDHPKHIRLAATRGILACAGQRK